VTDILSAIAMLKEKVAFFECYESLGLVGNENGDTSVAKYIVYLVDI